MMPPFEKRRRCKEARRERRQRAKSELGPRCSVRRRRFSKGGGENLVFFFFFFFFLVVVADLALLRVAISRQRPAPNWSRNKQLERESHSPLSPSSFSFEKKISFFSPSRPRGCRPQALPGPQGRRAERPGRGLARRDRGVLRRVHGEARAQVRPRRARAAAAAVGGAGFVVRREQRPHHHHHRRRGPPLCLALQVALGPAGLLGPQPHALPPHAPGRRRRRRTAHPGLLARDGPVVQRQGRLFRARACCQ